MGDDDKPGSLRIYTDSDVELEKDQARMEIIQNLAKRGYSPDTLAVITGVKLELIKKVLLRSRLIPEEEEIADMARKVMSKSLAYALDALDRGSPEVRYNIAMRMLGPATKLIGKGDTPTEEMENALAAIFAMQRDISDAPAS